MILTTIEELRLIYPNHAFDSIDGLVGFIDNSEHGFLEDKLGTPLYDALCQWYDQNPITRSSVNDYMTDDWNRLLLMAQRVVGFDALGRAAGMQVISVNNSGINYSVADDYPKADDKALDTFRKTCFTEALKSCDLMLATLEKWVTEAAKNSAAALGGTDNEAQTSDVSPQTSDIITLWQKSRYYYLAASMLIPSAVVLQQYLDFSESREKFIRMLPDLRFIQEEIITNSIGEQWLDHLVEVSLAQAGDAQPITTKSPLELRIIHQLRRVIVAWLINRTSVIKYDKEQKIRAHDDGVRKLQDTCNFVRQHQADLLDLYKDDEAALAAYQTSPLYVAPVASPQPSDVSPQPSALRHQPSDISPQTSANAALWTPPLL